MISFIGFFVGIFQLRETIKKKSSIQNNPTTSTKTTKMIISKKKHSSEFEDIPLMYENLENNQKEDQIIISNQKENIENLNENSNLDENSPLLSSTNEEDPNNESTLREFISLIKNKEVLITSVLYAFWGLFIFFKFSK